jgi:hypothetical protein
MVTRGEILLFDIFASVFQMIPLEPGNHLLYSNTIVVYTIERMGG